MPEEEIPTWWIPFAVGGAVSGLVGLIGMIAYHEWTKLVEREKR